MGSYAQLTLGYLNLSSDKSFPNDLIMFLFQESDRHVYKGTQNQINNQYGLNVSGYEDDYELTILKYSANMAIIRDRLDLIGITRKIAEVDFNNGLKNKISDYERFNKDVFKKYINILHDLKINNWTENLKFIAENKIKYSETKDENRFNQLIQYMFSAPGSIYGYPGADFLCALRLIIDIFPDHELLEYDLTDLLLGGYINEFGEIIDNADIKILENDYSIERIIILTEGETDKWILNRSIKLLYPHLIDYFHFMDFEGAKIEGGAGALANIVKAFAGAGIVNRIIAIFDNDTAADSALRSLSSIKIPNNIAILKYPDIELATDYPTIGPNGTINMNINGLAGSIEMYLGTDVLLYTNGSFTPIQWKGYDSKLKKYQGEINNKIELQEKFKEKLIDCEQHPEKISIYDWSGIKSIFNEMRVAFHKRD